MLALDISDLIRGDASAANVIDYTLHGIVGVNATQLADGQLEAAEGTLYTSVADGIAVTAITLVNTDTSARTVNLYIQPQGGTSRRIIPKDISLAAGYSLHTRGDEVNIIDTNGNMLTKGIIGLDDTPVDGEVVDGITSNWAYDHVAAADPHAGYLLESLLDAKGDLIVATTDNTPARLAVGTNAHVLTADSGEATGVKWAAATGSLLSASETEVFSGTSPTSWTDLDLSGTVGSNAALVLLKINSGTSNEAFAVRKNGDTDEFYTNDDQYARGAAMAAALSGIHLVLMVATDSSGVIEWITEAARTMTIDIIAYLV